MKGFFISAHNKPTESLDGQLIERMRLVLASSALLIIYIDPAEPDRFVAITYATLVFYTVYSAALFLLARRQSRLFQVIHPWSHWLDTLWYAVLVALSSGTNSLFFFGFFFAILTASFCWGYVAGLQTTITSAIIFTLVGLATTPTDQEFPLNRFLLRPVYLLVFGYLFAFWGGYELRLKRRLVLLKDLTLLSNPRLGLDHMIGSIMKRLLDYYGAETCLLVFYDSALSEYRSCHITASSPELATRTELITDELAVTLLALPSEESTLYNSQPRRGWPGRAYYEADNSTAGQTARESKAEGEAIATLLDARSFISVPLRFHRQLAGRLYLTRHRRFIQWDADFLLHVSKHIVPVIDNVRLVDQLASNAAEGERQRIARDLHDSIIQPYIGLQMGLVALQRKLPEDESEAHNEARKLLELTRLGIAEMRHYIRTLKQPHESASVLLPALQRFAAKFTDVTGITVQLESNPSIHVTDRLAAEVFQMVAEGLSNIRRHTYSKYATVKLGCDQGRFFLGIENENGDKSAPHHFIPASLSERAEALGGRVRVEQQEDNRTLVAIEIPL